MDSKENSSNQNLFSGMESLGFKDISATNLYNKKTNAIKQEKNKETNEEKSEIDEAALLYDRELHCPVCESYFKVRTVKTNTARVIKRDSDFFIYYSVINPYFYDVSICPSCGYSAMKKDFEKLRQHQIQKIKTEITPKWGKKYYGTTYDVDTAIERYKLALLNYFVIESKSSSKAMTCLKLAWMYRLKADEENELLFLKQALEGFNDAFFAEAFPIYSMDRFTVMYLIGELYRRTDDLDNALLWFSKVLTTPGVSPRLKDLTRDQKDLVNKTKHLQDETDIIAIDNDLEEDTSSQKKKGFLKSLFKK